MQIIPEVISKVTEEAELSILYNGKAIENAEELSPSETQDEPEVVIKGQDTYTLLMVVCGPSSCTLHATSPMLPRNIRLQVAEILRPVLSAGRIRTPQAQMHPSIATSYTGLSSTSQVRDRYPALFSPAPGSMQLFMWQTDIVGVAHFCHGLF